MAAGGWNHLFGGVPNDSVVAAGLGFPALPRLEYSGGLAPGFALGAAYSIDLGYFAPEGGVDLGMLLTAPMRFRIDHGKEVSFGMRFEPGLGFFFEPDFNFGVLANIGAALGFRAGELVWVGGGVDIPFAVVVDPFVFIMPVLFGPMLEVQPSDVFSITGDLKLGPTILARSRDASAQFGLKLSVGMAYRF